MDRNFLYLIMAVMVVLIFEMGRTIRLSRRIDQPLRKHYHEWNSQPRSIRYQKNTEQQRDLHAYSFFSKDQLLHTQIFLKAFSNHASYLSAVILVLGILFAKSNHLFAILSRSDEVTTHDQQRQVAEMFTFSSDTVMFVMWFAAAVIIIGLINAAFNMLRKQKISLHLLLVEAALKQMDQKQSP